MPLLISPLRFRAVAFFMPQIIFAAVITPLFHFSISRSDARKRHR
jgi:hypothetical protein